MKRKKNYKDTIKIKIEAKECLLPKNLINWSKGYYAKEDKRAERPGKKNALPAGKISGRGYAFIKKIYK